MNIDELAWGKMDGLIPAIVQDAFDGRVLMQGYMNRDALKITFESGQVTFWSRSRQQLWTKGETSGHYLDLVDIHPDCDSDCLLIRARQEGPTCHLGLDTCFDVEGIAIMISLICSSSTAFGICPLSPRIGSPKI